MEQNEEQKKIINVPHHSLTDQKALISTTKITLEILAFK
jgi:hypothetical protein